MNIVPPGSGYQCWLDADGIHIWQRHRCGDFVRTSKLPHGQKGWHAEGGLTVPSINCHGCGQHLNQIRIGEPPESWSGDAEFVEVTP